MTSLFGGGSTLNVNASGTLVPQEFTPTDGQTVFNLSAFTYTPGTNSLLVFINGDKQKTVTDFTETSNSSFTLTSPVTSLDSVSVIGFPLSTITQLNGTVVGNLSATGTLTVGQAINYVDTGIQGSFASTVAGYSQLIAQNQSAAVNASTNINVSNNAATATTNFGELGINSSTYTGSGSFNLPGAVYLGAGSTDLVIGTYTAKTIHFVYNSGASDAAFIDSTGFNVPTQNPGTNTTQAASTAFVANAVSGAAQIQPLPTPTLASNALTIPATAFNLAFRNATLATGGAATAIAGTPAALTIPSGATLGAGNGVQTNIAVIVLNNAGTLEYAVVNEAGAQDLSESGVISTTAISAAATSASVIYSNTARTNVPYRVVGRLISTQTTAGTYVTPASLVQGVGGQFTVKPAASMVVVAGTNGFGSTNTLIRRWSTVVTNQGTDVTYADSATLGGSFTINVPGTYAISYTETPSGSTQVLAITQNAVTVTNYVQVVATQYSPNTNTPQTLSITRYFPAGTIIRGYSNYGGGGVFDQFSITRVS